jgi:hypothetical protein
MKKQIFWIYLLSSLIYFLQGIEGLPGLSLFFYMKNVLKFTPEKVMLIGSITTLAWVIKPFWGYLSDNYLNKKTWILISLIGSILISLYFSLVYWLPIGLIVLLLTLNNYNAASRDVAVDGIMCVEGKKHNLTGKIQCFDDKTEILTKNGWKKYNEISKTDLAYSLDLNTNNCSYQPITNIFVYNYDGDAYTLQKKNMMFVFTPNHKLIIKTEGNRVY